MTRALALLCLVLSACAQPTTGWRGQGQGLDVWVESEKDAGGVLVVQLAVDADATVSLPEPEVKGLNFQPRGAQQVERVGGRVVLTQRYTYAGDSGMYEVPGLTARYEGPDGEGVLRSQPVWIDLGVAPPEPEIADIVEPSELWQLPAWWEWTLAGVVTVLAAGGILLARAARRPAEVVEERPPAHVRALAAWEAARNDPNLSDHDKALAISRIFREYMEEALRFHVTAWTTTEILEHLRSMAFLPEGNIPRARRLLRATDRVKFADAAARAEMFEELDADLRAFLESTRPRSWQAREEGAA